MVAKCSWLLVCANSMGTDLVGIAPYYVAFVSKMDEKFILFSFSVGFLDLSSTSGITFSQASLRKDLSYI